MLMPIALFAGGSLGSLTATMTAGRKSDISTYWATGFATADSTEGVLIGGAIGSMTAAAIGTATVKAIYWDSTISYSSNDSPVLVEITGNQSAGAVSTLLVDGVNMGIAARQSYNASTNTTLFVFGPARLNPFGAAGSTHSIQLS